MIRNRLKTGIATMVAIAAMSASVLAATNSYSWNTPFTVEAGWKAWDSETVAFAKTTSHKMKVGFSKTYTKGTASVGIYTEPFLNHSFAVASHDIAITTATAGVQYSLTFSSVSSGKRHYSFGSDSTASYRISSFSDEW